MRGDDQWVSETKGARFTYIRTFECRPRQHTWAKFAPRHRLERESAACKKLGWPETDGRVSRAKFWLFLRQWAKLFLPLPRSVTEWAACLLNMDEFELSPQWEVWLCKFNGLARSHPTIIMPYNRDFFMQSLFFIREFHVFNNVCKKKQFQKSLWANQNRHTSTTAMASLSALG